jgi:cobalt-precorrin 5A hydrolase/precorrin-3B C17-methyltransferase
VTAPARINVVVMTHHGLNLGNRLAALLAADLHVRAPIYAPDASQFSTAKDLLPRLFAAGEPMVVLASTGIIVRLLAPSLADKQTEPPVVAVAEDGSSAIPLLGGHHGANDLARRIADSVGGHAAITTAGDLAFGVALDDPPAGWILANPQDAGPAMLALLNGAGAIFESPIPWLNGLPTATSGGRTVTLAATTRRAQGSARRLVYHPQRLVLGIGCERDAPAEQAIAFAEWVLEDAGFAAASIAAVASLDLKADEHAVHAVAAHFGRPARFFSAKRLRQETPRLANPSETVFREVGCYGVAEGAALAAVGKAGKLVTPKSISGRFTMALAEAPEVLDATRIGRARGKLSIVGIGPGTPAMRSPEVTAALAAAEDWVGYSLYLDLAGNGAAIRHPYGLGDEEARTAHALKLAGDGRDVALVCSGDAGIYAMASLAFELLDRHGKEPEWDGARRAEIQVLPGITAMQAASAKAGAMLGHDFCAISLSDLMTPWDAIRRRIEAAAAGDFVVAFYNPVSQRRRHQFREAREILLANRPSETPVVLASNLGRPEELVRHTTLGEVSADDIDMLTVVLVGSSQTRRVGPWAYTPRGYGDKYNLGQESKA